MKKTSFLSLVVLSQLLLFSCESGSVRDISLFPVENGREYQFIDREGQLVINPQFSRASVFRDGLALVRTSGEKPKWGFISQSGKYEIAPNFKQATIFSEGLSWVVLENASPTAINQTGEIKITLQDAEEVKIFSEGLAAFSIVKEEGAKWGFLNTEGQIVIPPQFSEVDNFSSGKCAVKNEENKWGYMDKDGKVVIPYQFDGAQPFIDGKAIVVADRKKGLIDENGNYRINPQFSELIADGDLYLYKEDGKFGWCDQDGEIIINPQFSRAFPFNGNKLAPAQIGKDFGFIDKKGKIIINPQFQIALPFVGDLAIVSIGKKIGFIDKDGKYVVNPQFDEVAEDAVRYILTGETIFESVETDFFNIDLIFDRIKLESPEGLSLSSKISDVMTQFNLTEESFSEYRTSHTIIDQERISKDAYLRFSVLASPYQEVTEGWYTKNVFDPSAKIQGLVYTIGLTGRGFGKNEELIIALETHLKGYQKDEVKSEESGYLVYRNESKVLYIQPAGSEIILTIAGNSGKGLEEIGN